MSLYYRKHGKAYVPEYERPGRTKQSFMDDCDINKILAKAAKTGTLSHLEKFGGEYADFSEAPDNLLDAQARIQRGNEIFEALPGEVRREFKQDPFKFFEFVNDPANKDDLKRVLPQLAERGTQLPDVARKGLLAEANATAAAAKAEIQPEEPSETTENA